MKPYHLGTQCIGWEAKKLMSNIERSTLNLLISYSCLNNLNQTRDGFLLVAQQKQNKVKISNLKQAKDMGLIFKMGFQKKIKGNPWS